MQIKDSVRYHLHLPEYLKKITIRNILEQLNSNAGWKINWYNFIKLFDNIYVSKMYNVIQ